MVIITDHQPVKPLQHDYMSDKWKQAGLSCPRDGQMKEEV